MGVWDAINTSTEAISGGAARAQDIAGGAAAKGRRAASWTIQAVKERAPDREGWEKIGRLGWRVADHALAEVTRPYTAGVPVYRYVKEEYFGNSNLKNQPVNDKRKNSELQEALKRLDALEKELMEIKQKGSDQTLQIKNHKIPKFVNWKPIEWNFEIE